MSTIISMSILIRIYETTKYLYRLHIIKYFNETLQFFILLNIILYAYLKVNINLYSFHSPNNILIYCCECQ